MATDTAGRHSRMDPNLSSDDSQNPGAVAAGKKQKTTTKPKQHHEKTHKQTNQRGCQKAVSTPSRHPKIPWHVAH